jgi:demethylmenaquinone methyltransferase/2-methoxy-6-polyprenyl-1,4-benzoquinol methylase
MGISIKPYTDSDKGKKEQVAGMFNNIAGKYDFLNHFLSLNIDKIWRKKVVKILKSYNPQVILDVATGTGDLAIATLKIKPKKIYGIDISEGMLDVGRRKIKQKGYDKIISLQQGDAENIPFEDNKFDAVTVAFGVRNFENLDAGLSEIYRVLKSNGVCVVLEFTTPEKFPIKQLYGFYFKYILTTFGRLISKDNVAYNYLPESVKVFSQREEFVKKLEKNLFSNVTFSSLSFGVATIYVGVKE